MTNFEKLKQAHREFLRVIKPIQTKADNDLKRLKRMEAQFRLATEGEVQYDPNFQHNG